MTREDHPQAAGPVALVLEPINGRKCAATQVAPTLGFDARQAAL